MDAISILSPTLIGLLTLYIVALILIPVNFQKWSKSQQRVRNELAKRTHEYARLRSKKISEMDCFKDLQVQDDFRERYEAVRKDLQLADEALEHSRAILRRVNTVLSTVSIQNRGSKDLVATPCSLGERHKALGNLFSNHVHITRVKLKMSRCVLPKMGHVDELFESVTEKTNQLLDKLEKQKDQLVMFADLSKDPLVDEYHKLVRNPGEPAVTEWWDDSQELMTDIENAIFMIKRQIGETRSLIEDVCAHKDSANTKAKSWKCLQDRAMDNDTAVLALEERLDRLSERDQIDTISKLEREICEINRRVNIIKEDYELLDREYIELESLVDSAMEEREQQEKNLQTICSIHAILELTHQVCRLIRRTHMDIEKLAANPSHQLIEQLMEKPVEVHHPVLEKLDKLAEDVCQEKEQVEVKIGKGDLDNLSQRRAEEILEDILSLKNNARSEFEKLAKEVEKDKDRLVETVGAKYASEQLNARVANRIDKLKTEIIQRLEIQKSVVIKIEEKWKDKRDKVPSRMAIRHHIKRINDTIGIARESKNINEAKDYLIRGIILSKK